MATNYRVGLVKYGLKESTTGFLFNLLRRHYAMAPPATTHNEVLQYWFNSSSSRPSTVRKWFESSPALDLEITQHFTQLVEKAHCGELQSWEEKPQPALALVVLIDQFSRNIFRGDARAFLHHHISHRVAKQFLAGNELDHLAMSALERYCIYLVFSHEESLEDQRISVHWFKNLMQEFEGTEMEAEGKEAYEFAVLHKEVIDKCGRFPGRNAALMRTNTREEEEILKNDAYTFSASAEAAVTNEPSRPSTVP